jgi:predicted nucleic acid-binding protein
MVKTFLDQSHIQCSQSAISRPTESGEFPASALIRGIRRRTPTVVPDANVLFNDIAYSVKKGRRTTLVAAANSGSIRLLCPRFIVDEVYEHAGATAKRARIDTEAYLACFETNYLPLLRIIGELPANLWTVDEEIRLEALLRKDPDDVPAVRLALLTGSFYLSEDRSALIAAYGKYDKAEHHRWVDTLKAGGNAKDLNEFIGLGWFLTSHAGKLAVGSARRITKSTSGTTVLAVLAAAVAAYVLGPEPRRQKAVNRLGRAAAVVAEFLAAFESAERVFREASVKPINWSDESVKLHPMAATTRATIFVLSGHPASCLSAEQIADEMKDLRVAKASQRIREILRGHEVFHQPTRGRFQFGSVHLKASERFEAALRFDSTGDHRRSE